MTTDGTVATPPPATGAGRARLRAFAILIADRPYVVTAALILVLTALHVTGPDWPAAIFRTNLVKDHGALLWNNQWYGGHLLPGYSVITPIVASGIGTATLTAASCITSAWAWSRLDIGRTDLARRVAAVWFAVMASVDYLIGRTPFALGVAAGLLAILACRRERFRWAAFFALICGLASPLSGAFLLLVGAAWVPETRVWTHRLSLAPALIGPVFGLLFPDEGMFPFPYWRLLPILAFAAVGLWLLPRSHRSARRFLVLYAASALVFFFVPTALGGNMARLGEMTAGPMMAVVLLSLGRRRLVVLLAAPLLVWQFQSAAIAITDNVQDSAGNHADYYTGLLTYLRENNQPLGRVEIPFTRGHWESVYVAEEQPLARGWERQLDRHYNAVLYQSTITPDEYRAWIDETGVRFVALPDLPPDQAALSEIALLRKGVPWLTPVWSDKHWQVWEVQNPTPLLEGDGSLTKLTPSGFTFTANSAGTYTARIHSTYWFTCDKPDVKISATKDDWTEITVPAPGEYTITAAESRILSH